MAIARTASSKASQGGGTSQNVAWPAVAADRVAVLVSITNSGGNAGTPTDFTAIGSRQASGSDIAIEPWYKVCTGSETGNVTVSADFGLCGLWLGIFSGVNTSTPIDVSAGGTAGTTPNVTAPTVTTTVENTMLIAVFGAGVYGATGATTWSSADMDTEDANGELGADFSTHRWGAGIYYEPVAAIGATGTRTGTWSVAYGFRTAFSIALKPSVAAAVSQSRAIFL